MLKKGKDDFWVGFDRREYADQHPVDRETEGRKVVNNWYAAEEDYVNFDPAAYYDDEVEEEVEEDVEEEMYPYEAYS